MKWPLLAMFAHPDDESLLAAGTLAACAAAGLNVGIVSLTAGELGVMSGHHPPNGTPLTTMRREELEDAADVLGVRWGLTLDLPDGQLASPARAEAANMVEGVIAVYDPEVVLTFSAEGLYWHPDHVTTHEIVHEMLPADSICEITWPQGLLSRTLEKLRQRDLPADMWGLDPEAFGAPAGAIAHELDVSVFLDLKLRALRCHRSQLAGHALSALPDDLALELLGREWLTDSPRAEWLAGVVAEGCAQRRNT